MRAGEGREDLKRVASARLRGAAFGRGMVVGSLRRRRTASAVGSGSPLLVWIRTACRENATNRRLPPLESLRLNAQTWRSPMCALPRRLDPGSAPPRRASPRTMHHDNPWADHTHPWPSSKLPGPPTWHPRQRNVFDQLGAYAVGVAQVPQEVGVLLHAGYAESGALVGWFRGGPSGQKSLSLVQQQDRGATHDTGTTTTTTEGRAVPAQCTELLCRSPSPFPTCDPVQTASLS